MFDKSEEHSLAKQQSAYYLMILKSVELINKGYSIISDPIEEIKKYRDVCRTCSTYDKYAYEWLKDLSGIKGIINYRDKAESTILCDLSGTIINISNQQQGTIQLDCGLDAFFVPAIMKFNKDSDISARVNFVLGFRHDGLAAYEVHREGEVIDRTVPDQEEVGQVEDLTPTTQDEITQDTSNNLFKLPVEEPKLKILGKIDLSKIPKR